MEGLENKFYYKDGTAPIYSIWRIFHRVDGPSQEWTDGERRWHINGKYCTELEFNSIINEVKQMSQVMRLTDDRWWVREWKDNK